MSLVIPAVLPSSRKDLEEKLALFAQMPTVSRIQIDVVDGRFASPASWPYFAEATHTSSETTQGTAKGRPYNGAGEPGTKSDLVPGEMLPYLDRIAYEIDLMCLDAEASVEAWLSKGATRLTFHVESDTNPLRLLEAVRRRYGAGGVVPGLLSFGLALNLESDPALIETCIDHVEYVQFMGIARIGRQGQPFDTRVLNKIRLFHSRHPSVPIQVDGGVTLANAGELVGLGVTNLIVGSGILRAADPASALAAFEALQSPYGV